MFTSASQSSGGVPSFVRARGVVQARFERAGRTTRLIDSYETGGLRLRTPKSDHGCEAVILNTAGGMAGGDEWRMRFSAERKSRVWLTTQSAEKIYRTDADDTIVSTELSLAESARVTWVPQETILFNGSKLKRSLTVRMAESASAILLEMTVFGRFECGEQLQSGAFFDRWRIWRGNSLIFADDVRLAGNIAAITLKPAAGDGATAVATLCYVSQKAEKSLQSLRTVLDGANADWGASAWNGMLVARFAGRDPFAVRCLVARALRHLSKIDVPKVWSI